MDRNVSGKRKEVSVKRCTEGASITQTPHVCPPARADRHCSGGNAWNSLAGVKQQVESRKIGKVQVLNTKQQSIKAGSCSNGLALFQIDDGGT